MQKAIITGATGGLGRNVGIFLREKGWDVIGFGRNDSIGQGLGYTFKAFDLRNLEECKKHFEEVDVIFHCAALSSPWGREEDFYAHNVIATQNVLEMMKHHKIPKLVHVSTPSIYFDFTHQKNVKEDYRAKVFVNAYAKTKYEAEQLVLSANVDACIIRPRGIFGEYDSVLIPRLEKIAKKGFLPLIKGHDALIDVTYVGNVVYAMFLAATKDLPSKSIFNISNDAPLKISKLFAMVMQTLGTEVKYKKIPYAVMYALASLLEITAKLGKGKEPLITKYGLGLITYDQTLDLTLAKEILGYAPLYSIEEGLARYEKSRD